MDEHVLRQPSVSYWIDSVDLCPYPTLNEDLSVDVAVVGGGITGVMTAHLLRQDGLKVALLEARRILRATTGYTTAKVTAQHGLIYHKLIRTFGLERATQYARANDYAIQTVAGLVKEKAIDCDFSRQPAYVFARDEKKARAVREEAEAAARCGLPASFTETTPLPFPVSGAVRFDNQIQFHPLKFMKPLLDEMAENDVQIFENSRVTGMDSEADGVTLETAGGQRVRAREVVVATQYPVFDGGKHYFDKLYPSRSYVVAARIAEPFPEGMYISSDEPVRSLRSVNTDAGPMVLFVGEGHKTGQGGDTSARYQNLLDFARRHFTVEEVRYRWSAQDFITPDEVPYIGQLAPDCGHVHVAAGFRKWGMTSGIYAARIIRDRIAGVAGEWTDIFDPERETHLKTVQHFIKENLNVAKEMAAGKLRPADQDINLKNDEGGVIEYEGKKAGAYRDNQGQLHIVDRTCTHMGCTVEWNPAERSWDCPCHGSRFGYTGEVIEGPAQKPLKQLKP